jgi:dTDP-4-dehydrorhamnose reductase
MVKVAVFGSTGMLGSTITQVLESKVDELVEFNRSAISVTEKNESVFFDVNSNIDLEKIVEKYSFDYIINSIGVIKQVINEDLSDEVENAFAVNTKFAERLNHLAKKNGVKIIQIGTDCVFSGSRGHYSELDSFESTDTYSKSKILGEEASTESMVIRSSIIGIERKTSNSLMNWVLSRPAGSEINGFANHLWNGVTTLHFSEVLLGIIKNSKFQKGTVHLVPDNIINKFELIKLIAHNFGRSDLIINEFMAKTPVDRSLVTKYPEKNLQLWHDGGYNSPPSVEKMIEKFAGWVDQRFK